MIHKTNGFSKKIIYLCLSVAVIAGLASCASRNRAGTGNEITESQRDLFGGLGQATDLLPFMEAARTGTLPNGLRYYILENARPENRAFLTLAVNAGSVLEEEHERGLAHFLEHMAFNGTARFPEHELVNYLRSLGMRFGPEVNAYTSYNETVYGIEVPVETDSQGRRRIPATALAVIDDWSHAITFDPQAVREESRVIIEEYRSRLGANDRIRQLMLPIIFEGSPYANRRPIGLPEVIENATAEQLYNFYRRWYRADNMAIIFVGDFDGAALEASLKEHFTIPAPTTPLNSPQFAPPPPQKRIRAEVFTDPELSFTRVETYFKRSPQERTGDLGEYRTSLIDYLISQMLSVRFSNAAMEPETPFIGAGAGNWRHGFSARFYMLQGRSKAGLAEDTLKALFLEKESIRRFGFTESEIDRAKRTILSRLIRLASESDRQESNSFVDSFTEHFLMGIPSPDIEWELTAIQSLLPTIGADEILAAVRNYFAEEDILIFVLAPENERQTLPSRERIIEIVYETQRAQIAPPVSEELGFELLPETPVPGAIISEAVDTETGAVLWTLSNGARVILKETTNRNNEIIMQAVALGGTTSVPEEDSVSVRLAVEMSTASGIGPYSLQDLSRILADKQVSFSTWTSNFHRGFEGYSTTEDLRTLFELIYLNFTHPRIDTSAVEAMKSRLRTNLIQQRENPEAYFSQEIVRVNFGSNPHFMPLQPEDLDRINIDTAYNFIRRISNPADYTFVFTGNIDMHIFRSYVETYLASVPRREENFNTWIIPEITRPSGLRRNIYRGMEERSAVHIIRHMPQPFSESYAVAVAALREYLDIKFIEEIRENMGGVYSVYSNIALSPFPFGGELVLLVYFYCDPSRVDELVNAVETLLYRVVHEPVDAVVFARAVEALRQNWESSMQSNRTIAQSYANSAVLYNLPLSRLQRQRELFDRVTPADMQEVGRRIMTRRPANMILFPEGWEN